MHLCLLFSRVSIAVHCHMFLDNQFDLGYDGSFLIAPNKIIVAHLRGKGKRLCSGDDKHPRECYPSSARDFNVGDVIDFTWGMTELQIGKLVYAIVPSGNL